MDSFILKIFNNLVCYIYYLLYEKIRKLIISFHEVNSYILRANMWKEANSSSY